MTTCPFYVTIALLIQTTLVDSAGLRGQVTTEDVETALFEEISGSPRGANAEERISKLEADLRRMSVAVPHEPDGSFSHAVVRYILHRFFVQKYGWFIRGLEPNATVEPDAQGLQDLQEWVPSYLQRFIERIQDGRGVNLRELSIIAATLEDLIHKEAIARLDQAYNALDLTNETVIDEAKAAQVMEVWMMIYMLGGRFKLRGQTKVMKAHEIFIAKIKDWTKAQEWVHGLRLELYPESSNTTLDFSAIARVVEEAGQRYATYNEKACSKLKSELISVESKKAGRVRLTEFYKKGLSGLFDFTEKIDYLRALGAIDESDPTQPHIIIPNYVGSRPNCLVASSFYVVCCRNECEDLLASVEKTVASDTAKPEQILQVVSGFSTSTVSARTVSATLEQRLQKIAEIHGGAVPLHGRLFAQWMHHAFPRECPYPGSGSAPQTADEWMQESGQEDSKATKEEMMNHINNDSCGADEPVGADAMKFHDLPENQLPWDNSEQLLQPSISFGEPHQTKSFIWSALRFVALLSMASSLFLLACKDFLAHLREGKDDGKKGLIA